MLILNATPSDMEIIMRHRILIRLCNGKHSKVHRISV